MKPGELQQPASEVEVAEVIRILKAARLADLSRSIRRLAFERDRLREQSALAHKCHMRALEQTASERDRAEAELTALRENSAREHEAWEAAVEHGIQITGGHRFSSSKKWVATIMTESEVFVEDADNPVAAVQAVVKAAKQEAGTEPAAATERTTKHGR